VKRLIDQEFAAGSPEELLADLVRATPASEPAPFDRARILARIHGAKPSHRGVALRVGLAVLLLAGVATAAVAVEHAWMGRRDIAKATLVVPLGVAPAASAPKPALIAVAKDEGAPPVVVPDPAVSADRDAPAPAAPHADAQRARPVSKPAGLALSAAAKDGEDPAPVLEAIRALRSEGDPARASILLADYLKAHPRSVLAEDALALSIESALARHDARAASDLAKRYLAQYPSGRYRAYAHRAESP
jgi:hypothetical protein